MSVQIPLFGDGPKRSAVAAEVEEVVGDAFDVAKFVENFHVLVDVAGSAKLLKELILDLAVRGRLTTAEREDAHERAEELARRRRMLGGNGLRVSDDLSPVAEAERPYDVPLGWRWVRLRDLGGFAGGGTPSKSKTSFWNGPIPWVSPKDMKRLYIDDAEDHISIAAIEESAVKLIPPRSILYVVRGMILAHSFPVAVTMRKVTINQDMKALVLAIPEQADFVLRSLQAARRRVLAFVERSSHGTCRLDSAAVENLPLALPPLAEQKRIVAKVNHLMAVCDELEARRTRKRDTGARLTKSAFDALTVAEGPEEFDAAWKRVVENFDVLINAADQVNDLRSLVLELAATGRLLRPAARSASLVRTAVAGEKGGSQPLAERSGSPSDWNEERGWLQVPLGATLSEPLANGRSVPDDPSGFPVLRLSALRGRYVDFGERKLGAWTASEAAPFVAQKGDVLFVRGNGAIRLVGRACMVGDPPERVAFPDTAIRARLRADILESKWLWYVWESRFVRRQVEAGAKTTAGIFKISQDVLYAVRLPLPTLVEQRELVAKIEQLMEFCDELERGLRRAEDRAAKLAEAAVQELLA